MKFYVDCNVIKSGNGSEESPFKKITEAAKIAKPGDEVIVAPGIYMEYVDPINSGLPDKRIVYRSEIKGKAIITGAEPINDWQNVGGTVWKAIISNEVFGDYNPYTTLISGDWFNAFFLAHTGEVYLNDKSMYEVASLNKVKEPEVFKCSWDPDFSIYTWYAEQQNNSTVIYANFQGKNPNEENVEINVRRNCFYPSKEGVGYITLSGFTVCRAATQWAPPTAYQEGMIGPHWSKGWIIEDCEVFQSKCAGISLGKYLQKGNDNKWSKSKFKDGTQTERDAICQAVNDGWSKETVGSHIIRRCNIHHCGQAGIVGHMGCAFSLIEDNNIHHINNKQSLNGAEIGGIKLHAAIDVIIRKNHFHHNTRGLWLDWQAQGTRVSKNLFHDNTAPFEHLMSDETSGEVGEDIFIEVSHGPTLVDNNIMLSDRAIKVPTQGVAFVHNLIAGAIVAVGKGVNNGAKTYSSPRYTPYHVKHGTRIAGFMTILHGDMRFYNNVFVQRSIRPYMKKRMEDSTQNQWDDNNIYVGTMVYDGFQSYEDWLKEFDGYCGYGSSASDRYYMPLPVWCEGNAYFNGAKPCELEKGGLVDNVNNITLSLIEENGSYYINTNLYKILQKNGNQIVTTETLGEAFEPEQKFENPDGTPIIFNEDYFDAVRDKRVTVGPFEAKEEKIKVW